MTCAQHLIDRILNDPRLAYYFDPLSRSMEMLTEQRAQELGKPVEEFRASVYPRLKFEVPTCPDCRS